jgi:uncharacterized protein (TIGR03435 family)
MRSTLLFIGLAIMLAGAAFGESPESLPRFATADIRVSPRTTNANFTDMSGGLMPGGIYWVRRATMLDLVRTAYGVKAERVAGGPSWLEMNRFDIYAKAPADVTSESVKLMLRTLLAERFNLVVHEDTRPMPAFALTASKKPQLTKSDGSGESGCKFDIPNNGPNEAGGPPPLRTVFYTCHNVTMEAFANEFGRAPASGPLGENPVADQTGLEGAWDFTFKYNLRGNAPVGEVVTLTDAVEKQLGLKVEPSRIPLKVLVVDSVNQKPSGNSDPAREFKIPAQEFEVASIKPTDPDFQGGRFQVKPGGRIMAQGIPLKPLIGDLWGLTDDMIIGAPKAAETDRWDIVAKAPPAAAIIGSSTGQDELPVDLDMLIDMLKTLLTQRFEFKYHMEDRPMPAYTLSAVKPKMKKADPATRTNCKEGPAMLSKTDARDANPILGRLMTCTNSSMAQLADMLPTLANGYVHSAVLDSTGLEGGWDFTLSFSTIGQLRGRDGQGGNPNAANGTNETTDPNGAISLPDAMEKQLGIKMELVKRPVQVMVVDHLESKPTDN